MDRVTRSCGASGFRFWPNLSVLVIFERRSLKNSSNIVDFSSFLKQSSIDFSILKCRKGGVSWFDLAFLARYYERRLGISTCQFHYQLVVVSFVLSRQLLRLITVLRLTTWPTFFLFRAFAQFNCGESLCQVSRHC